ncbi:MAG: hypothetical protein O2913_08485 [Chloroflexi bacterium]|nr:hypothetical protein [Chloroflexota bacterium]
MNFKKFWTKPNVKVSFKAEKRIAADAGMLEFDLLYHLTYLSAVSASGIPRSEIFNLAATLPVSTAGYFTDVDRLVKNLNYDYADACRIVGEKANNDEVKSLFLRLSGALSTGEPESEFLNQELKVQAEAYSNSYERKLESLKKWTDGFSAAVVSSVLIVVVAAVSTLIYDLGTTVVVGLVGTMMAITFCGAWVIWSSSPKEPKMLTGPNAEESQRLPRLLLFSLGPISLLLAAVAVGSGLSIGAGFLIIGLTLFPIGLVSNRHDDKITKRDDDVTTFYRVLGATASSIGTTPEEAMARMDLRSTNHLESHVRGLRTRLRSRATPKICWDRFVAGTGSELIRRSAKVFLDGISLGGDAEEVGTRTSTLTRSTNFLRAKRKLIASTFGWLSITLHATIVFLLVFVIDIVGGFGNMVTESGLNELGPAGSGAPDVAASFGFSVANMELLQWLTVPVIIALSLANSFAAKAADGGYILKFFYYFSMMMATSGVAMVASPILTGMIFGVVADT